MNWTDYPDRHIAERVCTPKELEALKLRAHGYGHRRTARILGVTRDTIRARVDSALVKIERAKENAA